MKDESKYYLVYRVFSDEERPCNFDSEKFMLYGWTGSKKILKGFLSQRDKKKYKYKKIYDEDAYMIMMGHEPDKEHMIDFVEIESATDGQKYVLFMTEKELKNTKALIRRYFIDLARLVDRDNGKMNLLIMYWNLEDKYLDPLKFIGFNPPELDVLFDDVEEEYREVEIDDDSLIDIDGGYCNDFPHEVYEHQNMIHENFEPLGYDDISPKVIYSLESFIKILKDDM